MRGKRVLIVEDNPITRRMMRFALESEGYEVVEAGDGRDALDRFAKAPPDLLVQDFVLPDMDGLQLLEAVRALPGGRELPILMVTGMVSHLDALRSQASGPTSVMAKPLEPSRLLDLARSYLAGGRSSVGAGRRVLVVDDEPIGRKLAALRLADAGFEVETAATGEEALAAARARAPEAILSDVMMPGMDGFGLCQRVRQDPDLSRVCVVLVSASFVEDADQRLASEVGANALVLRSPDLRAAIEAVAQAVASGPPTAGPVTASVAALHAERVQVQLEKQVARNEALLRQGAIQAAALSVVRGLAAALANPQDVPKILADVLVHCLDAAGLSTGLLYLSAADQPPHLQAQAGLASHSREAAANCFGHPEFLQAVLDAGQPKAFRFLSEVDAAPREFGEGLGRTSALIVPFRVGDEPVGLLVLGADSQDLGEPAWLGFGRALAAQFAQTIAVGRFVTRGAASEVRYRTLMERAHDAILLLDATGLIVEANQQAEALLGRPGETIVGRPYRDFVVPEEWPAARQHAKEVSFEAGDRVEARHLLRGDGSVLTADLSASRVRIDDEMLGLVILRDVTERERLQHKLVESEEHYRLLFESNPHAMWVFDPESLAFLEINDAAIQLYGYSRDEFLRMTIKDIRPASEIPRLLERLATLPAHARTADGVWTHRRKDGSLFEVETASNMITFRNRRSRLVLATDVSERKKLQEQLLHAQKMEAMGRLAGGVAHDFNNILGVVIGYGELARRGLDANHPAQKRLEEILKASGRAAALTRQLLAFSRKEVIEPKVLKVNDAIGDLEKMLHRLIGEDVELQVSLDPAAGRVRVDRGQLDQMIINLAVNARDAMPGGGRLGIETRGVAPSELPDGVRAELREVSCTMIAVSDTGHGMDAATRAQIFEPFFTTKEPGKGTGLGLATVFGAVKQSQGTIEVDSEPGSGATFRIYLPQVDQPVEEPTPVRHDTARLRGLETILLVEDEESLREVVRELLREGNYFVLDAATPEAALATAGEYRSPIHLVISDVVMPKMKGPELVERLRRDRPELPALFISGYPTGPVGAGFSLPANAALLRKPFSREELLLRVREVLQGEGG